MKYFIYILIFVLNLSLLSAQSTYSPKNVKAAFDEKKEYLIKLLAQKNLTFSNVQILITVIKNQKNVIIWAKNKDSLTFDSLTTYKICYLSGILGPKRKSGDMQVPEGFYYISYFNPYSSYYFSLKINYPNQSDLILGDKTNPGGDIFIHGNCVSIGCIPITDDKIKELYILSSFATINNQSKIPVYIFPFEMNSTNMKTFTSKNEFIKNIKFWGNLKQGYDLFVNTKKTLKYTINKKGEYIFKTK